MKILSRVEPPWACRREEPEQPHHQIHVLLADPCTDGEVAVLAALYANLLNQPVYLHYWQSEGIWHQTYAVTQPDDEGDVDGLPAQP